MKELTAQELRVRLARLRSMRSRYEPYSDYLAAEIEWIDRRLADYDKRLTKIEAETATKEVA